LTPTRSIRPCRSAAASSRPATPAAHHRQLDGLHHAADPRRQGTSAQGDIVSGDLVVGPFVDGFSVTAVPEPPAALLTVVGLLGVLPLTAARHKA